MYIKNTLRTHALAHTQVLVLLAITLSLSSLVHFTTSHTDMLGLAWDLGAVTTGPVTVPLVIALGMGVAGSGGNASPLTGFFFFVEYVSLCVFSIHNMWPYMSPYALLHTQGLEW